MTFEERLRKLERQVKDTNKKICCIQNNCPDISANEGNALTCEADGLYVPTSEAPSLAYFNGIVDYGDPQGIGLGETDITQSIAWYNGYANSIGFYAEMKDVDIFATDPNFDSYQELWMFQNQEGADYRPRLYLGQYAWKNATSRFYELSISFYSDPHDTSTNYMEFLNGGTHSTGGVNSNRYAVMALRHNQNGKYFDLGVATNSGDDRAVTFILGKFYNGEANTAIYDTDGAMIYDSGTNKFRAREGGVWKDVISAGGGGGGDLQATTDAGNTTTNQLIVSTAYTQAYRVVTADGSAGLGFSVESGGWSGIYLGGLITFCNPAATDKGNIYIGVLAGQGRTDGGDFNMYLGYQSGIGAPVAQYKFYLAQGANNHLMYGDFQIGGVSVKKGVYAGIATSDWTSMALPSACFEAKASDGSAGTAPFKMNAGTNLTVPVNGTLEYDGTNLYFTTGGVRKTVTLV